MKDHLFFRHFNIVLFSMLLLLLSSQVVAQTSETLTHVDNGLPVELTRQSVADYLASLSDKEVRETLKVQLYSLADKQQAIVDSEQTISVQEGLSKLGKSLLKHVELAENIDDHFIRIAEEFKQGRVGYGYLMTFALFLVLSFVIASLAGYLLSLYLKKKFKLELQQQLNVRQKIKALAKIFVIRLISLGLFYLLADSLLHYFFHNRPERITARAILEVIFVARLTFIIAATVLSPKNDSLRLYLLSKANANVLTNRIIIISLIASSDIFVRWSRMIGVRDVESRIGFWLNLLFYCAIIWLVWRSRFIFEDMLLKGRERVSKSQMYFVKLWPKVVVLLSLFVWIALEYVLSNTELKPYYVSAAAFSLIFINFVPFINIAIFSLIENVFMVNHRLSDRQVNFQYEVQDNLIRALQLLFASVSLFGLSMLWGLDITSFSNPGSAEYFIATAIELISIPVLGYVLWLSIDTLIAYKLASEEPDEEELQEDSEGGTGLSRMATVLPILRMTSSFIIIVFSIFAILSSLGVNTTPLLAGASVIGLAIGFGAQTLVKDIVSGLFFLVDDAFRMGEYVEIGGIKGTVERIALRSLRLRHHLGAQHTIPYGEVATLTNYSRDWVIMKLRFRVPHDTDVEKIRKLFKKLGKDMLDHPTLGKDFLAPFKSQGVLEVDEVGMLIRGKFTCKPGGQFMIRKEIYVRVQQIFAQNNIEFAKRKVEVQLPDNVPKELQHQVSAAASEVLNDSPAPKSAN